MIFCHQSDSHGIFKKIFERSQFKADVYLNTGDFFPNSAESAKPNRKMVAADEAAYQMDWLHKERRKGSIIQRLMDIYDGAVVITVPGNHDYISLAQELRRAGYTHAYDISTERLIQFGDFTFAGYGEVEYYLGEWNGEVQGDILRKKVHECQALSPNMLLTHAPPRGILDSDNAAMHFGDQHILNWFSYGDNFPGYHFFGHVHAHASIKHGDTWFVNGAMCTKFYRIEDPASGLLNAV